MWAFGRNLKGFKFPTFYLPVFSSLYNSTYSHRLHLSQIVYSFSIALKSSSNTFLSFTLQHSPTLPKLSSWLLILLLRLAQIAHLELLSWLLLDKLLRPQKKQKRTNFFQISTLLFSTTTPRITNRPLSPPLNPLYLKLLTRQPPFLSPKVTIQTVLAPLIMDSPTSRIDDVGLGFGDTCHMLRLTKDTVTPKEKPFGSVVTAQSPTGKLVERVQQQIIFELPTILQRTPHEKKGTNASQDLYNKLWLEPQLLEDTSVAGWIGGR